MLRRRLGGSLSAAPRTLTTLPRVGACFFFALLGITSIFPRRHRWYCTEARQQEGEVLPPWNRRSSLADEDASSTTRNRRLAFAASGGGGFGRKNKAKSAQPPKSTQNQPPNKKGKVKGARGRTFDFLDDASPPGSRAPRERTSSASSNVPILAHAPPVPALDKWGLPIPTIDTLFPPLPVGTELLPAVAPSSHTPSLSELRHALRKHLPLALHRFTTDPSKNVDATSSSSSTSHSVVRETYPPSGRPPMELRLLHVSPPVLEISNFLTDAECNDLRTVAVEHDEGRAGSDLVGPVRVESRTFPGALSKRTSTSWFCRYSDVPQLLARASQVLNVSLETIEEPQLVRYRSGQEFTWHYDEVPAPQLSNGGQRLATLLYVYSIVRLEQFVSVR